MAFGLKELSKTRVYQEAKEEAKLETVPALIEEGLSVEKIAQILGLTVEQVRSVQV